ncbi:MAG: TMEM175 family protein [Defluviitaleaceae bacterium]|nr:TMEM175 family protein [Defluviitaleaceae bacterium]
MLLSIPLPATFDRRGLLGFLLSIFIYLVSFIVVGSFWNMHHHVFHYIDSVTNRIIWYNFAFLFFLSLIPIFTKWVIEHPGVLIPAIGYDVVFILVQLVTSMIFHLAIKTSEREEIKAMREKRRQALNEIKEMKREAPSGATWPRFAVSAGVVAAIIAVSILVPVVSTVFLLGGPVAFSVMNVFYGEARPSKRRNRKIPGKTPGSKNETDLEENQ